MFKISKSGKTVILLMLTLILFILAAGCFDERLPRTHNFVYKTDSNGTITWQTDLDSGMQDYAGAIIETSDWGYLMAGSISDNPHGYLTHDTGPRFVKLDMNGKIVWDQVPNSTVLGFNISGYCGANTVFEKPDGNFIASLNNGWVLIISPDGAILNSTNWGINQLSAIPTSDGGMLLTGYKTIKVDAGGDIQWKQALHGFGLVFQVSDGRYLINTHPSGSRAERAVTCLAPNGTVLWTKEIDIFYVKPDVSFRESEPGIVEYTYSFDLMDEEIGMSHPAMTTQMTINPTGEVISQKNLSAAGPLARTMRGEYMFVAFPFADTGKFSTMRMKNAILHIVKLSEEGAIVWDKPLLGHENDYPDLVISTGDGGHVVVASKMF